MGGRAEPGTNEGRRGGVRRDEGRGPRPRRGEAVREQVITPRAGRVGAKGRGAVAVQRPNSRRGRSSASKETRQTSFEWKSALPYVPSVLKTVLAVALGLLAYLGYRTAVSASFFQVKAVDVAGTSRSSREEIRAAVMRLSNAGVWQADLEVIAKELKELPWVRDAVVTRVLPDGLRVRVTEREPRVIARTAAGKLVDRKSRRVGKEWRPRWSA